MTYDWFPKYGEEFQAILWLVPGGGVTYMGCYTYNRRAYLNNKRYNQFMERYKKR